jgi:hypothetical protein
MAKDEGMTNSGTFWNGSNKTFEIARCFTERATAIQGAYKNLKYIFDHSEKFTESEALWTADMLANEFYTILCTAMSWEKKEFKKE